MENWRWTLSILVMTCLAQAVVSFEGPKKLYYTPGVKTEALSFGNTSDNISLHVIWRDEHGDEHESILEQDGRHLFVSVGPHHELWEILVNDGDTPTKSFSLVPPSDATTDPLLVRIVDDVTGNIDHVILLFKARRDNPMRFSYLYGVEPTFRVRTNTAYETTLNCQETVGEMCNWMSFPLVNGEIDRSRKKVDDNTDTVFTLPDGELGDEQLFECQCGPPDGLKEPRAKFMITPSHNVTVKRTQTYEVARREDPQRDSRGEQTSPTAGPETTELKTNDSNDIEEHEHDDPLEAESQDSGDVESDLTTHRFLVIGLPVLAAVGLLALVGYGIHRRRNTRNRGGSTLKGVQDREQMDRLNPADQEQGRSAQCHNEGGTDTVMGRDVEACGPP